MVQWVPALVAALTGTAAELDATTPAAVVQAVGPDRVAAVAASRRAAGQPWPFPVDRPDGVGTAQWTAILGAAVRVLPPACPAPVVRQRNPDADDLRLLREVPPHHLG